MRHSRTRARSASDSCRRCCPTATPPPPLAPPPLPPEGPPLCRLKGSRIHQPLRQPSVCYAVRLIPWTRISFRSLLIVTSNAGPSESTLCFACIQRPLQDCMTSPDPNWLLTIRHTVHTPMAQPKPHDSACITSPMAQQAEAQDGHCNMTHPKVKSANENRVKQSSVHVCSSQLSETTVW